MRQPVQMGVYATKIGSTHPPRAPPAPQSPPPTNTHKQYLERGFRKPSAMLLHASMYFVLAYKLPDDICRLIPAKALVTMT